MGYRPLSAWLRYISCLLKCTNSHPKKPPKPRCNRARRHSCKPLLNSPQQKVPSDRALVGVHHTDDSQQGRLQLMLALSLSKKVVQQRSQACCCHTCTTTTSKGTCARPSTRALSRAHTNLALVATQQQHDQASNFSSWQGSRPACADCTPGQYLPATDALKRQTNNNSRRTSSVQ